MPASLHAAEDIGLELAARLSAVRRDAGAETDLGAAVFRGRRVVDDDRVPCTSIIEGADRVEEPAEGRTNTDAKITQAYLLMAYVDCDVDNPNDAAHAAIRDMKRAVFKTDGRPDRTLGGKVKRVAYRGRDIGPRADGASFVVAVLEVHVTYSEDLANP